MVLQRTAQPRQVPADRSDRSRTASPFGGTYVQAINKTATHPNAAKLWEEYLYSDEGQLLYLKGYCNPIRYDDLTKRGVVPADLAAKLPDSSGAVFPTPAQLDAATHADHQGLGRGHGRDR